MVQVDLAYGENNKAVYLPYAIGLLVAYAWQNETVRNTYELGRFVFTREHIDQAVGSFDNPFLVGFSTYVWNAEYNHCFARILKDRFPNCLIVFGGHNVPPDTSLLEQCDYIDILVHGQGEEAFRSLLVALAHGGDLADIPNISYRDTRGNPRSNDTIAINAPLEDYPSPYLTGLFDDLIEKNKDYAFSAILETSRDCPFGCAFCDWGQLKSKTRRFSMERVLREIDWFADHKICYIWGGDANFGTYKEDAEIARYLVETKTAKGYPQLFNMNYSKTNVDGVFEINRLLHAAKMSRGVPLSFQSLLPEVLDNIHRRNMDLESFSRLIALYNEADVPMYSELIIGLPGETYESFCRGIGTLLELGQHNYIDIFRCELLPNAPMSTPQYIERHRIKTIRTPSVQHHIPPRKGEVYGYSDIVVETATMSADQLLQANMFALLVQSCHHMGLLKYVAIYLHRTRHTPYDGFYTALLSWLECAKETFTGRIFASMKRVYEDFLASGTELSYVNPVFGNLTWFPEEGLFLELARSSDAFYADMRVVLKNYISEDDLLEDLMVYQQGVLKQPGVQERVLPLRYDWTAYFESDGSDETQRPRLAPNSLHLSCAEATHTWEDYARENVWFGRRAGKTMCTGDPDAIHSTSSD